MKRNGSNSPSEDARVRDTDGHVVGYRPRGVREEPKTAPPTPGPVKTP
jgi:hypothetical protein